MEQLILALAATTAVLAARPQIVQQTDPPTPFVEFEAVPGQMEFTGVLCARPLQPEDAEELGLTAAEVRALDVVAREAVARYELDRYVAGTDEYLLLVPEGESENSVARTLMATGAFQYVEPDWRVYPIGCPNDAMFGQQWHLQANRMQSCDAWDHETGDPSVVVAICDTGIYLPHQDLQLHRREGYHAPSSTWESQGGPIDDINGHGTNCTGAAAANGDNGLGVSGVGWNLGHRMMRVSDHSSGSSTIGWLTEAARVAADAGDRVASVSYTGVTASSVRTAGTYIRARDALLVWAAGNASTNYSGNRDDSVIVVGATNSSDTLASFSNYGSLIDLTAPGVGILTTSRSGSSSYSAVSGTSFACPLTAGLCALIWSRNSTLTPQQVEDILRASCEDLGTTGVDNTYGHGRINAARAIQMAPDPLITISYPDGRPDEIAPTGGTTLDVIAAPAMRVPNTSAAMFWVDTGAGFVPQPAQYLGADTFRATFPPATCPSEVRYYFEFPLIGGGEVTSPLDGGSNPFTTLALDPVQLASIELETAVPWLVGAASDTATSGIWERVNPIGTGAQPEDDHTLQGSFCYVTGQGVTPGNQEEADVDGGATTLITQNFDLSGSADPSIGYWRWYSNDEGGPVDDVFRIDMTTDQGQSWHSIETIGPGNVSSGWIYHSFRVRDFAVPTATVRLRFVASDFGGPSIVEAAIDDLEVFDLCSGSCGLASYCTTLPNSTGAPAWIGATGSTSFAANDLVLVASDCPANSVGIFAYSPDQASAPLGNGTLCLGGQTLGTVIRLGIVSLDSTGTVAEPFDNQAPPIALGQIAAGETWNFQFVFRDVAAGGTLFNLTNGLSVTFCP